MNCDDCQPLLIDLVCDELDSSTRKAVTEHAASCERCGPDLAQLREAMGAAEALPVLEVPAHVETHIMSAARQALVAREASAAGSVEEGGLAKLLAWLRDSLATPQLAMAAALLLVIGFGARNLMLGGADEPSEAAPSAAVAPVPAMEAEMEAEEAPAAPAAAPEPEPAAEPAPLGGLNAQQDEALDPWEGEPPASKSQPAPAKPKSAPKARQRKAKRKKSSSFENKGGLFADDFGTRGNAGGGYGSGSRLGEAQESRKAAPQEPAQQFAPPPPARRSRSAPQAAAPSVGAGSAGAESVAEEREEKKESNVDTALARARAARKAGDCRKAVKAYDPLLRRKSLPPDVYFEAADCHRRLGNTRMAATWLEKAERVPALRSRARAQLRKLEGPPAKKKPSNADLQMEMK